VHAGSVWNPWTYTSFAGCRRRDAPYRGQPAFGELKGARLQRDFNTSPSSIPAFISSLRPSHTPFFPVRSSSTLIYYRALASQYDLPLSTSMVTYRQPKIDSWARCHATRSCLYRCVRAATQRALACRRGAAVCTRYCARGRLEPSHHLYNERLGDIFSSRRGGNTGARAMGSFPEITSFFPIVCNTWT
jgi:hypothetical protein